MKQSLKLLSPLFVQHVQLNITKVKCVKFMKVECHFGEFGQKMMYLNMTHVNDISHHIYIYYINLQIFKIL